MCGKTFSIYDVHIPRKYIESCSFTHAAVPDSELQVEYTLKVCFFQDGKGGGRYDLLYQNSIRKYEDDLEH